MHPFALVQNTLFTDGILFKIELGEGVEIKTFPQS